MKKILKDFNRGEYVLISDFFTKDEIAVARDICDNTVQSVNVDDNEWWIEHITDNEFIFKMVKKYQIFSDILL
jgi:hypothetical protein